MTVYLTLTVSSYLAEFSFRRIPSSPNLQSRGKLGFSRKMKNTITVMRQDGMGNNFANVQATRNLFDIRPINEQELSFSYTLRHTDGPSTANSIIDFHRFYRSKFSFRIIYICWFQQATTYMSLTGNPCRGKRNSAVKYCQ